MNRLNTADYLFLKFKSTFIKLEDVSKEYYPHLCKEKVLEKARQQKFPFTCFRIDESQMKFITRDIRTFETQPSSQFFEDKLRVNNDVLYNI